MAYEALSRKWRPKTFGEIVGQGHVTRALANAISRGKIHHAYLFAGTRGVGKTTFARILARALNCEKGPTPSPCLSCPVCVEILAGSGVDVQEIDGASNTGIDDVRRLRENAAYAPARSRYKIYIIDEVHMLSKAAFNGLLKILEEPPAHVVFVFATTEPNRIPDTILSRVQRFDFRMLTEEEIFTRLREMADVEKIAFEEMLELAACGAKVLMLRCVEYARRYNVPVHVRSSYTTKPGTIVSGSMEDIPVEEALITGVAHDRGEAKITVVGLPDTPGHAAKVFRAVSDAEINIDMVLQNISKVETNKTDITFTLPTADGPRAVEILTKRQEDIGFTQILFDDHIGKVSLVGAGMRSHPGVTATFCEALAKADINIDLISTSEIRISVLVKDTELDDAVRVIHDAFGLGGEEEAVVHAGTGR